MTEKTVYFDSSKCTACKGCQVACKTWNNLPSPLGTNEAKWSGTHQNPADLNGDTRLIITFNELEGDSKIKPVKWAFGRRACQHCTDAPCASVCPGGALVRNEETGFVEVYQDKCVGCQYCHSACPFDVPRYESNGLLDKTVIDKAIAEAVEDAKKDGIHGKATTPYLLAKIKDLTGGDSLDSNIQLVFNNARLGAQAAVELAKLEK